jgi:peroxiredoxin
LVSSKPDVRFIGISVDVGQEDSVKAYLSGKKLPYSVLLPTAKESYQLDNYYGGATPQSIIIDKQGNVVEFMVGFNESITKQFEAMLEKMLSETKEIK